MNSNKRCGQTGTGRSLPGRAFVSSGEPLCLASAGKAMFTHTAKLGGPTRPAFRIRTFLAAIAASLLIAPAVADTTVGSGNYYGLIVGVGSPGYSVNNARNADALWTDPVRGFCQPENRYLCLTLLFVSGDRIYSSAAIPGFLQ